MDYVLEFVDIGPGDLGLVGGKGLNLGRLWRAGVPVPPGFCVTTAGFQRLLSDDTDYQRLLGQLDGLGNEDLAPIRTVGAQLRAHIATRALPDDVAADALAAWREHGVQNNYAVRSSATAEDLPTASFAGQQDTYLNVRGEGDLLARIRDCMASLYSDRAIAYRIEQGIEHRDVSLCVVVQRMVDADKSGIMFTADPMTGHREVITIDAGFGLGEALVSGLLSADLYKLDKATGRLASLVVGDKKLAIRALADGGTETVELAEAERRAQVLDDTELAELARMAVAIETLYGCPQDIEWCFAAGALYAVQARPITSLYPLPEPAGPGTLGADTRDELRAYVCFNHFQVMTDAMPPMSCSLWQLLMPFGKTEGTVAYSPWSAVAGGRLFIDVSRALRQPMIRDRILTALGNVDELAVLMLRELSERDELRRGERISRAWIAWFALPRALKALEWLLFRDVDDQTSIMGARFDGAVAEIRASIASAPTLAARLERAQAHLAKLVPRLLVVPARIAAGFMAGRLLRKLAGGDRSIGTDDTGDEGPSLADDIAALGRGLTGNVTTDMDLAVGDLADVARGLPAVAARLRADEVSVAELREVPGGPTFVAALDNFLDRYGMRAPSEIDPSRARFRDDPRPILRTIAGNLSLEASGAHRAHHEDLMRRADEAAERIVARCRRGLLGPLRAGLARRLIRVHRALVALREHPKFALIKTLDVVRDSIHEAGDALHAAGRLDRREDVWLLRMDELIAAVQDPRLALAELVAKRSRDLAHHRQLAPPRVITSAGETPRVSRDRGTLPEDALLGSPASAGVIEGIARVIRDPHREVLERGEILIAPFTDPGWTPLFLNAAGLVMEVGGLMTHGSVVAREYGIPAVVCIPDVTSLIETGMRIRVNGDLGYVEILERTTNVHM